MKTIGLIAVAVIIIGVIGYVIAQPAIGWPTEDRRVAHPNGGFSIVQPIGWEKSFSSTRHGIGSDMILFRPIKSIGAPGLFTASRMFGTITREDLEKQGYTPITFNGKAAFERRKVFNSTREQDRSVMFETDGVWCDVTIRRPLTESIDDGVWLKYAESYRLEPIVTSPAPATAPLIDMTAATTQPGLP